MGEGDGLKRRRLSAWAPTDVSPELERRLFHVAACRALDHFANVFESPLPEVADEVVASCFRARDLGLFRPGAVREDEFIALRALAETAEIAHYVESGVFTGGSLFAFHDCPSVRDIWAIDPDLGNLMFRDPEIGRTTYESDLDFGEIDFGETGQRTLVFFDDHIDTVKRIEQAHTKGFRLLAFDDSTGFHGITQRLYPAAPTIGMLRNLDALRPGDRITWCFPPKHTPDGRGIGGRVSQALTRLVRPPTKEVTEVTLDVTERVLARMRAAASLIARIVAFPDLQEFIALKSNGLLVDRTKYLVFLKG